MHTYDKIHHKNNLRSIIQRIGSIQLRHSWVFVGLVVLPCTRDLTAQGFTQDSKLVSQDASADVTFVVPRYSLSVIEVETVATCLILEAASQGTTGMRGVMSVIRNRSRGLPELFTQTVMRPRQFSSLNRVTAGRETLYQAQRRARKDQMWDSAIALVREAGGTEEWNDPTGGATHFTRSGERNRWTKNLRRTVTIASHSFYKQ